MHYEYTTPPMIAFAQRLQPLFTAPCTSSIYDPANRDAGAFPCPVFDRCPTSSARCALRWSEALVDLDALDPDRDWMARPARPRWLRRMPPPDQTSSSAGATVEIARGLLPPGKELEHLASGVY